MDFSFPKVVSVGLVMVETRVDFAIVNCPLILHCSSPSFMQYHINLFYTGFGQVMHAVFVGQEDGMIRRIL